VLDTELRTPPGARLFTTGGEVLILTGAPALLDARASALTARGAHIESLPTVAERVMLPAVLDRLGELEVNELHVEAGPTLAGALVRQSLVDELLLYVAPKLLGDQAKPLVELDELQEVKDARTFTLIGTQQLGEDLRLQLRPRGAQPG
jgi:diaminohydroxyphosphoribosylaminopyrimidine deaminase/5-amino-6-(5-phosphoribosylamino)uracil reductase